MAQWTETNPGAGDTDALRAWAWNLDALVREWSDGHYQLQQKRPPDVLRAEFLTAFDERVTPYCTRMIEIGSAIGRVATAALNYATTVDQIAEDSLAISLKIQGATSALTAANTTLSTFPTVGTQRTADEVSDAITARDEANTALTTAKNELAAQVEARRGADTLFRSALEAEDFQTAWRDAGVVMSAGGISRPAQLTTDAVTTAMLTVAEDVLNGDATDDQVSALSDYITAHLDDPGALADFFNQLGGDGTVELIDAIGNQVYNGTLDPELGLDLARALQAGVSRVSADWTPVEAAAFADSMVEGNGAAAAIGFLFADPQTSPMGKNLTLAMSTLIDTKERLHGEEWAALSPGGGGVLANLLNTGTPGRAADPASTVFETLGYDPDTALDWLTSERVDYWFRERNWSSDGYQGVGSLWAGVQDATGADLGDFGGPEFDNDRWEQLQKLNAEVFTALGTSEHYTISNTSPYGSAYLTVALERQLPVIGTILAHGEADLPGYDPSDPLQSLTIPGFGELRLPKTADELIHRTAGVALSYEDSYTRLRDAIRAIQDGATTNSSAPASEIMPMVIALQGLIDGAAGGAECAEATRRDAEMNDAISQIAGAAAIASSFALENPYIGLAVDMGINMGADALVSWTSIYDETQTSVVAKNQTQKSAAAASLSSYLLQNYSGDELEAAQSAVGGGGGLTQLLNSYMRAYVRAGAIAEADASS